MKRMIAALIVLALAITFVGCGNKAEETTTITGMVMAIEGNVISLVEMDSNRGGDKQQGGQRPSMPENMEGFENFEGFEGGAFPWGEGEMPEFEEGQMPQRPEGSERPNRPTGEDGEMSDFQPFGDGQMPNFGNFEYDGETTQIDIGTAHISVEEDGVKASGSISDIKVGSFVTITRNAKGEVTNVLVTARSGFGGMGGFRDFGNFGNQGNRPTEGSDT